MGINIAVAGKGGTGKTTTSALLIRSMIDKKAGKILALDADPNSNLNELLGIKINMTVGQLVEDFKKNGAVISSGIYKDQMVEMNIHQAVAEGKDFDLLAMGRGEGPGCYCAANNLFKKYIDMLQDSYDYIVMDNEAGMEHLSRKTTHNIRYLLLISDPSLRGVQTAARLRDLSKELKINIGKVFLILSRVDNKPDNRLLDFVKEQDFEILGIINSDKNIIDIELSDKSIFELPPESTSLQQVKEIVKKLEI
ncbi:MAG: AAA family ATPase [Actinomycetota bacterium]|nr:AAA family ATPase [Actinomycetota bacterium]